MSHIFQRYFNKHGHFPRVVVDNGIQQLTVEFAPGYVTIRTSSPYQACVYITRHSFLTLLAKVLPLARKMRDHPAPDHDVPLAMREAYQLELSLLQERRAQRKSMDHEAANEEHERARRQRQRFLKARERAARRQT